MKKYFYSIVILAVVTSGIIWFSRTRNTAPNPLDGFAQCLAGKGVTIYGADSCSHCQAEKKEFGSAFEYVPYVECSRDPKRCLKMNIQGYPTWIFPDGRRLEGAQGLGRLSEASGCELPEESIK